MFPIYYIDMESGEGSSFGKKLKVVAGAAVGTVAATVAIAGLGKLGMSDKPSDYQLPVTKHASAETQREPNPYTKKPVIKGHAKNAQGETIEINGVSVNADREVIDQYYQIQSGEKLLAYADPDTNSRPIPVSTLKEYGIDLGQPTLAQPVFGEVTANLINNIIVNKNNTKAGQYWQLSGENAEGHVVTAYLEVSSAPLVSERPVINLSVGK